MTREEAARRAIDAGETTLIALDSYGRHSPEFQAAFTVSEQLHTEAEQHGCTRADFDTARHNNAS